MNIKRRLLTLTATTAVVATGTIATAAATATNQSLIISAEFIAQLAEEMRTNNPALLATTVRTNAAAAAVKAVRTWDDPMLTVGGMGADEMMRRDEGDILYGVEQKLPLFGKPAAARRVARAELDVETLGADYEFQSRRAELAKAVFRAALA
ncbi:MAG TPA: TolC family protein, partial [Verrucomicrobiota bacterium]|nr:TolC family protein [Verrucomicrobiota bacterium]